MCARRRHRRRGLHRQSRRARARRRRPRGGRARRPVGRPRRVAAGGRAAGARRDSRSATRCSGCCVDHRADAVMHFAAWLDGRRVGRRSRSSTTRTTSPARWPCSTAMRDAGREALHLLVDLRGLRRAGVGADRRDARHAADQRLRRNEADHRARAAAPRARARHQVDGAAVFQRRRRASGRHRSARITPTRFTSSRWRFAPPPAARR